MDPVPGPMAGWSTEAEKERLKMQNFACPPNRCMHIRAHAHAWTWMDMFILRYFLGPIWYPWGFGRWAQWRRSGPQGEISCAPAVGASAHPLWCFPIWDGWPRMPILTLARMIFVQESWTKYWKIMEKHVERVTYYIHIYIYTHLCTEAFPYNNPIYIYIHLYTFSYVNHMMTQSQRKYPWISPVREHILDM